MKTIAERKASLKHEMTELENIEATEKRISSILKKAGFDDLQAFLEKLHGAGDSRETKKSMVAAPTAIPKKRTKTNRKGKRPRITDAQLAEMKALRKSKMSQAKVAAELNVHVNSVLQWEKKKFKRR